MEKQMTVTCTITPLYKQGKSFLEMISKEPDESSETHFKLLLKENPRSKKIDVFLDEAKKENGIGYLNGLSESETVMIKQILINSCPYAVTCVSEVRNGNTLNLKISWEEEDEPEIKMANDLSVFQPEIDRVTKAGYCTREEAERNIRVMMNHRVPEALIFKVLAQYRKYDKKANVPKTVYVDPDPDNKNVSLFTECLLMAVTRHACIYEGDKSVGKNMCVETVAMVMNMPYYQITFSKMMSTEDIYGAKVTDCRAQDMLTEKGATAYIKLKRGNDKLTLDDCNEAIKYELAKSKAASVQIIQEQSALVDWLRDGGVLCFNEMNLIDPNFFASFSNTLTDGSEYITIPGIGEIKKNTDCVLCGTQNAAYLGTSLQNEATISRFGCIQFDYPKSVFNQLKAAVGPGKLLDEYFHETDRYYGILLSAVHNGQIANSALNIRGFVRALECVYEGRDCGIRLSRQIQINVINTCPVEDRSILSTLMMDVITL